VLSAFPENRNHSGTERHPADQARWTTPYLHLGAILAPMETRPVAGYLGAPEWHWITFPAVTHGLARGINEMVRRRVGFGSAVYIRRIIHEHRIHRHRSG
jgi:hypothetical protein